jgi:predicted alpha/beta-hydrolase family hydrolase
MMRVVLAHGASGSAASMQPWVDGLVARSAAAAAIDIPVKKAENAIDAYRAAALATRPAGDASGLVIGGQSYGGRVASLLAATDADEASSWRGLVLICYPLHRPGAPEGGLRTEHWPRLRLPILMLSGEADPFARIDLLRSAVSDGLPQAELVTYPRVGHSLSSVLDDAVERIAAFVSGLEGASAR